MPSIHDISRRGAVPALAALGRREPLTMEAFKKASGLTESPARLLRLDLEAKGLIQVEESPVRGAAKQFEIRLTPLGRDVAKHLVAAQEALEGPSARPRDQHSSR